MSTFLVLADDLTGANDTGVQFAKQGFSTVSLLDLNENHYKQEVDVLVFNTETRSLNSNEAYRKIKAITKSLSLTEFTYVYKKIDSTIRGNVGEEIDALLDTRLFDVAIVLPAYPKNGRITVGGYHLVNQCLLEDSEAARDPKCPVSESYLPTLIGRQIQRSVGHIDIQSIRNGETVEKVKQSVERGEQIVVVDSSNESDMKEVASALLASELTILWVGAAGLAESLSEVLSQSTMTNENEVGSEDETQFPVLTIAGSVSVATRQQIQTLAEEGNTRIITANPLELINSESRVEHINHLSSAILEALDYKHSPILTTDNSETIGRELENWKAKTGQDGTEIGDIIADSLGKVGANVATTRDIGGLILTGGDIAYRTCAQLGIKALRIIDEVEEGIPLCEVMNGRMKGMPVITKAGAFGQTNSLVNAIKKIKNSSNYRG